MAASRSIRPGPVPGQRPTAPTSDGVPQRSLPDAMRSEFVDVAVAMAEAAWRGDIHRWNEIRCSTADRMATGFVSSRLLGELILARAHSDGVAAADAWHWVRAIAFSTDDNPCPPNCPEEARC